MWKSTSLREEEPEIKGPVPRKPSWNSIVRDKRQSLWDSVQAALNDKVQDLDEMAFLCLEESPTTHSAPSYALCPTPRSTIPLQWKYVGPRAIPNSLADRECAAMCVKELFEGLNSVLGTTQQHGLGLTPATAKLLDAIRCSTRDFGEAYGKVRQWWDAETVNAVGKGHWDALSRCEELHESLRQAVIKDRSLALSAVPPRRVWDLYSNRVLPLAVMPFAATAANRPTGNKLNPSSDIKNLFPFTSHIPDDLWTVSHSWVADNDRTSVHTPINGKQWPVPIPRATSLDHVRTELLNMGAEYVWLDVLCLRQQDVAKESDVQRTQEWRIDVPTIGHIYQGNPSNRPCIIYFNGLGLALDTSPAVKASTRHWFNRVWTLQEYLENWLPGGLTGKPHEEAHIFFSELEALPRKPSSYTMVKEIMRRKCSNELDRIAGLAYCLDCESLPLYDEAVSSQHAWELLLKHISPFTRTNISFLTPAADAPFSLFPSWEEFVQSMQRATDTSADCGWHDISRIEQLQLIDKHRSIYTDDNGSYKHMTSSYGLAQISLSDSTQLTSNTSPQLVVRLAFKAGSCITLQPLDIHGVVLGRVPYVLFRTLAFSNSFFWSIVEAVEKGANGIYVVRWAAMRLTMEDDRELQRLMTRTGPVTREARQHTVKYLNGDDALKVTKHRERYEAAFQRRKTGGMRFMVAE
ncbi:heterokaryon incompatibility protein [Phanerochaete sordida]|uniref:Heterokaryon incompatibility protein n=1 Tax=Phanerochaete sordida TaxID=48140 RepID=A0A9P3FXP8_9APHY|nr:heterokaryon incompatibility protein [Phanerochaete sordida]